MPTKAMTAALIVVQLVASDLWAANPDSAATKFDGVAVGDTLYYTELDASSSPAAYKLYERTGNGAPRVVALSGDASTQVGGKVIAFPGANRLLWTSPRSSAPDRLGSNCLIAFNPTDKTAKVLVDNKRYNTDPAVSPDGKFIAFFSTPREMQSDKWKPGAGYALHIVDTASGVERELVGKGTVPAVACPPAWSPDVQWIAFVATLPPHGQGLYIVKSDGTMLRRLAQESKSTCDCVVWPQSNRLVVTTEDGPGLYEIDFANDTMRLAKEGMYTAPLSLSPDRRYLRATFLEGPTHEMKQHVLALPELKLTSETQMLLRGAWRQETRK